MIFRGEEIYQLIPQRPPVVMVDVVWFASNAGAKTGLTVLPDNIFVRDGVLREPGLIEHIAQSAAVFAGYGTFARGEKPKLGFIGEIKDCELLILPLVGSELHTEIRFITEVGAIRLVHAEVRVQDTVAATCQMKIFLKND